MKRVPIVEHFTVRGQILEQEKTRLPDGVLCRVVYPICNIGEINRNKRVYEKEVWEKVHNDPEIQEKLRGRCLFGHAEHPKDTSQSSTEKVSHVVNKIWTDGNIEKCEVDVLDTPYGRIVDTLLRAGCGLGVSTRAEGELEEIEPEKEGEEPVYRVIPEAYSLKTIDFTADPSTYGAYPESVERDLVKTIKAGIDNEKIDASYATVMLESMKSAEAVALLESIKGKKVQENIEDEVAQAGDDFKKFIEKEYKVPWHTLSDATLRQALEDFKKSRKKDEQIFDLKNPQKEMPEPKAPSAGASPTTGPQEAKTKSASIKAIYDNGGKTADRYTVVLDAPTGKPGEFEALILSSNPEHPQGFSQMGVVTIGSHLGKEIPFEQLPVDVQQHIKSRLSEQFYAPSKEEPKPSPSDKEESPRDAQRSEIQAPTGVDGGVNETNIGKIADDFNAWCKAKGVEGTDPEDWDKFVAEKYPKLSKVEQEKVLAYMVDKLSRNMGESTSTAREFIDSMKVSDAVKQELIKVLDTYPFKLAVLRLREQGKSEEDAERGVLSHMVINLEKTPVSESYKKWIKRAREYYEKVHPNLVPDKEDIWNVALEFWSDDTGLTPSKDVEDAMAKEIGLDESKKPVRVKKIKVGKRAKKKTPLIDGRIRRVFETLSGIYPSLKIISRTASDRLEFVIPGVNNSTHYKALGMMLGEGVKVSHAQYNGKESLVVSLPEAYNPQLESPEAKEIYRKMLDYLFYADDPQYNKIVRFRNSINRLKSDKDKEELKKYFQSEFGGDWLKGQDPWDYYAKTEAVSEKIGKDDVFDITVEFFGSEDEIKKLPFHPGELHDVVMRSPGHYMVTGSASGWELRDVISALEDNEGVTDTIIVIKRGTGEKYVDWDEVRSLLKEACIEERGSGLKPDAFKPGDYALYRNFGIKEFVIVKVLPWASDKDIIEEPPTLSGKEGDPVRIYFGGMTHSRKHSVYVEVVDSYGIRNDYYKPGTRHFIAADNLYKSFEDMVASQSYMNPDVLKAEMDKIKAHPITKKMQELGLMKAEAPVSESKPKRGESMGKKVNEDIKRIDFETIYAEMQKASEELFTEKEKEKLCESKTIVGMHKTVLSMLTEARKEAALMKAERDKALQVAEAIQSDSARDILAMSKEIEALKAGHAIEIKTLKEQHAAEISKLKEEHQKALREFGEKLINEVKGIYTKKIDEMQEAHKKALAEQAKMFERKMFEQQIDFKVKESGLDVSEQSLTLLRNCSTMEEVEKTLDNIRYSLKEGLLHSGKPAEVTVDLNEDTGGSSELIQQTERMLKTLNK